MTICPRCGRNTASGKFCERCGAPLANAAPQAEPVIAPAKRAAMLSPQMPLSGCVAEPVARMTAEPSLEIDSFCILFENLPGFLRFRFGSSTTVENVLIVLENPLTGVKTQSRKVSYMHGNREIVVPVPAQMAGAFVLYVTVSCEIAGRKQRFEGEVQMLVVRPREAQKAADQLSVTITNNINNGNASDVHVSQRAVEELARLAQAENPFEELRRVVLSGKRVWAAVQLDSGWAMPTLPAQPADSVRESITIDLGTTKLHFFSSRIVRLGRRRDTNDISLRPPEGVSDEPYRVVSRAQCCFGHCGDKVVVHDGQMDDSRVVRPSSYGTYWNDSRIASDLSISAGESGVLSLAGAVGTGAVSLDAKACLPIRACATCPHANRTWCGDGRRPALMLTRRDGITERYVALWSCFPLEEADPSFEGVVIFRKDGAFAWRRGRRCGWLVPGEALNTDFGQVNVC